MGLHEIDLRAFHGFGKAKEFNEQTWCVSELFWSFLKQYKVNNVKKCVIIVTDDYQKKLEVPESFGAIRSVKIELDLNRYFESNDYERRKKLLEVTFQGMRQIAIREGWELEPLEQAYESCIRNDIKYHFFLRDKLKSSLDRKNKIGIWCEWDIDTFKLFWVLLDKNNVELNRENFFYSSEPSQGEFAYYLNWQWIDNRTVLVKNEKRNDLLSWELDVSVK